MMGTRGGSKPGSGRKKRVDEEWSRSVCIKAVTAKYTSVEKGLEAILSGMDERLKLLVWQHILGVPETISKVKLSDNKGGKLDGGIGSGIITVNVVRTIHNKDVQITGKDDTSQ